MATAALIFPHQLFEEQPALDGVDAVHLIEDSLYFGDPHYPTKYHKLKLMLHRATMRHYADELRSRDYEVSYHSYADHEQPMLRSLLENLREQGVEKIQYVDPTDFMLSKRLGRYTEALGLVREVFDNPNFFNTSAQNERFFGERSGSRKYYMADFYQWQRKRLDILIKEDGESPVGGKWSFDTENRKKLPKSELSKLPGVPDVDEDEYVAEARTYVEEHFADHYGHTKRFPYPTTHADARVWLADFLKKRFAKFGTYEDAIVTEDPWVYHGVFTPMLNIGLLTPDEIVRAALDHYHKNDTPLNSVEGFIRQIIGWREFMRAMYELEGVHMRNSNHWEFENELPDSFYDGTTGLDPADHVIKQLLELAYAHHIDRLMILGNLMFVSRIHPRRVYYWFMEMFIDAYDWVMVPNVYGMSQNAPGDLMTTKPYFSGSNYIRKMSAYSKSEWAEMWDGLYWKFIFDHADRLRKNPRWAMMVATGERMGDEKRKTHEQNAAKFREINALAEK